MKFKIGLFLCALSCGIQASQARHGSVHQKLVDTYARISHLEAKCLQSVQMLSADQIEFANTVSVESLLANDAISALQKKGIELAYQKAKVKVLTGQLSEEQFVSAQEHVHQIYRIHDELQMQDQSAAVDSDNLSNTSSLEGFEALKIRKAKAYFGAYQALRLLK